MKYKIKIFLSSGIIDSYSGIEKEKAISFFDEINRVGFMSHDAIYEIAFPYKNEVIKTIYKHRSIEAIKIEPEIIQDTISTEEKEIK